MRNVFDIDDENRHLSWTELKVEFGINSTRTQNSRILSVFNIIEKFVRTF